MRDLARHVRDLDQLRHVVQEHDEQDHGADAEERGERHAQPWHESGVAEGADRTQHEDRVHERPDIDADRDLRDAVTEEGPQDPWTELARRQLEDHHRRREGQAGNGDQGPGDHGEHGARGRPVALEHHLHAVEVELLVDLDEHDPEHAEHEDNDSRYEAETLREIQPQALSPVHHVGDPPEATRQRSPSPIR